MLHVIRNAAGGPSARSEGPYTGQIWRDMLFDDGAGYTMSAVFFTPCARTFWHSHPGGQLLIVKHGEGLVGDADGTVRVNAGDLVWTPPDVRHWHGGTTTRSMMHIAVTLNGVDWQEEVPEADYATWSDAAVVG